jgi:hypothetical protein
VSAAQTASAGEFPALAVRCRPATVTDTRHLDGGLTTGLTGVKGTWIFRLLQANAPRCVKAFSYQ